MRQIIFLLSLLAFCIGSIGGIGGIRTGFTQHPDNSATDNVKEGAKLFAQNCSACHGDTGKGGRAPDLTSGQWKHGGTDEDLLRNIVKGIAGTQMPAIALSEAEAKQVIAFLRALSNKANGAVVAGNVEAGKQLFLARPDVVPVTCSAAAAAFWPQT